MSNVPYHTCIRAASDRPGSSGASLQARVCASAIWYLESECHCSCSCNRLMPYPLLMCTNMKKYLYSPSTILFPCFSFPSGVGKSSLLLRFADNTFSGKFWHPLTPQPHVCCCCIAVYILNVCVCVICRELHHHDRCGLQDPDGGDQWREGEATDLGHGRAGALPHNHLHVRGPHNSHTPFSDHKH